MKRELTHPPPSSSTSSSDEATTPSPPRLKKTKHSRHSRTSLPAKLDPAQLTTQQVADILTFWRNKKTGESVDGGKTRDDSEERAFELSDIDEEANEELDRRGKELTHRLLEPFQKHEQGSIQTKAVDTVKFMQVLRDCMVPFDDATLQNQSRLWFDTGKKAREKARKAWDDDIKQDKIHCDRIQEILDQMALIEADNVAANKEAKEEYEKIFAAQIAEIESLEAESQPLEAKFTAKLNAILDPAYCKREINMKLAEYYGSKVGK